MSEKEIEEIVKPEYLNSIAHVPERARPKLVARLTGGKKICNMTLRRIYKAKKVKHKMIKKVKKSTTSNSMSNYKAPKQLKMEVAHALDDKRDIVFVDECLFTFSTLPKKAYAAKGHNVHIDPKEGHSETIALVAGIDATDGLVYYDLFKDSVNQIKFN